MALSRKPPRQEKGSIVIILLIVLIAMVSAIGIGGALYIAGELDREAVAGEPIVVAVKPKPPIYIPLEPPLVVNFERNGRIGFLQANVEIMTRELRVQEALAYHAPVIRNNLLLLLSSKGYTDVSSREGKEQLRKEALAEVNRVLLEQGVSLEAEDLYFTGFVMQ
jgi:flagellar FliL protein